MIAEFSTWTTISKITVALPIIVTWMNKISFLEVVVMTRKLAFSCESNFSVKLTRNVHTFLHDNFQTSKQLHQNNFLSKAQSPCFFILNKFSLSCACFKRSSVIKVQTKLTNALFYVYLCCVWMLTAELFCVRDRLVSNQMLLV